MDDISWSTQNIKSVSAGLNFRTRLSVSNQNDDVDIGGCTPLSLPLTDTSFLEVLCG